jgi:beta-galactosidase
MCPHRQVAIFGDSGRGKVGILFATMNHHIKHLRYRVCCVALWLALAGAVAQARTVSSFDTNWRFLKADASGAEQPAFDHSDWRQLSVPHDWSIEGPFAKTNKTGGAGGFLPSGVGWYRKAFTLPPSASNQCVFIEFDGVMENSTVWLNGQKLGHRPNGYVSFRYELTPHLKLGAGATNVLAVRTDTSAQPASRWYSGAGIYRHVRLVTAERIHFEYNGNFVTASVRLDTAVQMARVVVPSTVVNPAASARSVAVQLAVFDSHGKLVASNTTPSQVIAAGTNAQFQPVVVVTNPQLWDVNKPQLYRAVVSIRAGEVLLDEETIAFGIRDAKFTPEQGFVLNGRKVLLKGVCLHHDGGAFGAAVPLGVWERRLTALRALGCNAIRTAHNPVAPEFLDLCDRMGFLVMDEFFDCWTVRKNPHDYHKYFEEWSLIDLRDTVRRDRNHPSIIVYSAGNEIHDTPKPERAKRILAGLVKEYKANDPTRPVTQGLFRPNVSGDYTNGLADLLDVVGTNYRDRELLDAQRAKPERKIVGTEQRHDLETWLNCRDFPSHAGQFLWTGIDYLGEARQWPRNAHASGLIDRAGFEKPLAYQRQSWWSDKPMVCLARRVAADDVLPTDPGYGGEERHTQVTFTDWSPRNRERHPEDVEVYSNCDEVELLLNGRSLGSLPKPANDSPRKWKVEFAPGELKAVGRNGGREAATQTVQSAGPAARVRLVPDAASVSAAWDDVVFVRAYIEDEQGIVVPLANDLVTFNVNGPGALLAVDNGDCMSTELFQASQRKAYGGRCVAMVRATAGSGEITITAHAAGLKSGSTVISAKAAE